jgi:hypothetical protein
MLTKSQKVNLQIEKKFKSKLKMVNKNIIKDSFGIMLYKIVKLAKHQYSHLKWNQNGSY